jgi:uncharacterized repeat protein (TIGR03803 family)
MGKFVSTRISCLVFVLCIVTAIPSFARTFKTLVRFDGTDGAGSSSLVQGKDGNFYGTTWGDNGGEVFKMTPLGKLTILYHFCSLSKCADGEDPYYGGLLQAANGNFYATTTGGGTYNLGTVFEITPQGKLTTLYSFGTQTNDGDGPYGGLVQGANGEFYGTTIAGGTYGEGTVFKMSPAGKFTTLHSFCRITGCPDGMQPLAGLTQGPDGNFYGTTSSGGTGTYCGGVQCGTVFKITPAGRFTTLHSFCSQIGCSDGAQPLAALVLGRGGRFYGTTAGSKGHPDTVFKISLRGSLTTLYTFCQQKNCSDGYAPMAGLIEGSDGDFYGTTAYGGITRGYFCRVQVGCGTVFKITPTGKLTTLHRFCAGDYPCSDGEFPAAALVLASDGAFYGSTVAGGIKCDDGQTCGTVFRIAP